MNKTSQQGTLWRALSLVSSMTFLSRILGFVRDISLAYCFGVHEALEAFLVATRLPAILRRMFAEGAFSEAFSPLFSFYLVRNKRRLLLQLLRQVKGLLYLFLCPLILWAVLNPAWFLNVFTPGFAQESARYVMAKTLIQMTFPYLFFISMCAFFSAILNAHKQFMPSAITPLMYNLFLIAAAYVSVFFFHGDVRVLGLGFLLAGISQWLFLRRAVKPLGYALKPLFHFKGTPMVRFMRLVFPALLTASVYQINLFVDTVIASCLPAGSIAWLYYAERLSGFPLGILGVGVATVILPRLAQVLARTEDDFSKTLDWGVLLCLFFGLPAGVGLFVLAKPIVVTLFFHGKFTMLDIDKTSAALKIYALGVPVFMLERVLSAALLAKRNTRSLLRLSVTALSVNLIASLSLFRIWQHVGVATALLLSSISGVLVGFYLLKRDLGYRSHMSWVRVLFPLFISLFLMACPLLLWGHLSTAHWASLSAGLRCLFLISLIALGGIAYFAGLFCVRFPFKVLHR